MLNITAVEMKNLPDWDVDWNDRAPQRDRQSLTVSNSLLNEADGIQLKKRAILHIMHILAEEFPALAHLQALLPSPEQVVRGGRSNVVPMEILFKDKKYKSEMIRILSQFAKDAQLSGKPEV